MDQVLVINRSSPELNHLAAALSQRGLLYKYVRPYAYKGRWLEKMLTQLPGDLYQSSFGRRNMPAGLDLEKIQESGVFYDFCMALIGRTGKWFPALLPVSSRCSFRLNEMVHERIRAASVSYASNASVVLGNILVALDAFRATSGMRILNAPSAHYKYVHQTSLEESKSEPEFSVGMSWLTLYPGYASHIDQEFNLADRILVGSTFSKETHIQSGISAEKILVVPYGADLSFFSEKEHADGIDETFNVLFVGNIGQGKGISYLLKAYQKLQRPETSLTLVGNFVHSRLPFEPYYPLFTHIPHVPHSKMVEIYHSADVFVFPTLMDGMGIAVLEAMACGLPIITTSNGPGDIVRDGVDGFIVPARDVDALVDRMEYLRTHVIERKQMGRNARKRALLFDWSNYTQAAMTAIFDGHQLHPG